MEALIQDAPSAVRPGLLDALGAARDHIRSPGTWLTATQRLGLAAAARAAIVERRQLGLFVRNQSPAPGDGELGMPTGSVSITRRIILDPSSIDHDWYRRDVHQALEPQSFVELIGVVASLCQLDFFTAAIGVAPIGLGEPVSGAPSRTLPEGADVSIAWVPTITPARAQGDLARFYEGVDYVPHIMQAMSLVPTENASFFDRHSEMFLWDAQDYEFRRALNRPQMESLGVAVSIANRCSYCRLSHQAILGDIKEALRQAEIPHVDLLTRFATSLTAFDDGELTETRHEMLDVLGWDELIDAASISSTFNAINRIANATGIQLDDIFDRDYFTTDHD